MSKRDSQTSSRLFRDFESVTSFPVFPSGSFRASSRPGAESITEREELEAVLEAKQWTVPYADCPNKELIFSCLVTGSDGDTSKKELVVCWHGYPDTNHTWEPLMKHLTEKAQGKYIVIAPKLPGYEETTHLGRGCYSMLEVASAMNALHEVLMKKYEKHEFHYVGHDWGGVAGQMVCQLAPSVVKSYINVAVPFWARFYAIAIFQYPRQILNLWYIIFLQMPFLPQIVIALNNFRFLDKRWQDWSPGSNPSPTAEAEESTLKYYWDLVKEQFQNRLVFLNALDYYRCLIRGVFMFRPKAWKTTKIIMGLDKNYPALAKDGGFPVPIYSIFGADDGCIMKECVKATHANRKGDFPKGLNMTIMEDTGHWLHIEKPDMVNRRIARFLKTLSIDKNQRDSCTVS